MYAEYQTVSANVGHLTGRKNVFSVISGKDEYISEITTNLFRSSDLMGLLRTLYDFTGSAGSNVAAAKPDIHITKYVEMITKRFLLLALGIYF